MVGVIITSHGNFCKETVNSAEMIVGKQENVWSVPLDEKGIDKFETSLNYVLDEVTSKCETVIILADIMNATPYNCSLKYIMKNKTDKSLYLISGYNLAVVIELLISRSFSENVENLLNNIIDSGKNSLQTASLEFDEDLF